MRALFFLQQPDNKKGSDRDISVIVNLNVNGTTEILRGCFSKTDNAKDEDNNQMDKTVIRQLTETLMRGKKKKP